MMTAPLAERMRPLSFAEIVGQEHLLSKEGLILRTIKSKSPLSIILWGPPGAGKTSLARLYAKAFNIPFQNMSAIFNGIAELKKIIKELDDSPLLGRQMVLFVDEIHRFNKAQQDAFLPFLEKGSIVLVGATVENPSFYLNAALLSRVRVLQLHHLDDTALGKLIDRYEERGDKLQFDNEARHFLITLAQGDGRYLYNLIENVEKIHSGDTVDLTALKNHLQKRSDLYDRAGEQHYNLISALHKSVRGSDVDAALYWFARMLEGGEEPLYLARRLIRMASEDIGLADPNALPLAVSAFQSYQMLGSPEGELALAEVVIYLSLAPKSNASYVAYNKARQTAATTSHLMPPAITLNAPTALLKELGYGKGYRYDHDQPDGFSGQNYLPDLLPRQQFYTPVERGYEREMSKRLTYYDNMRKKRRSSNEGNSKR